ncbi:MAG: hypothetical protein NUW37_04310 [Planctomycetes bacterium]|nr:hypothetical protein [Planctomycetota bacterium]
MVQAEMNKIILGFVGATCLILSASSCQSTQSDGSNKSGCAGCQHDPNKLESFDARLTELEKIAAKSFTTSWEPYIKYNADMDFGYITQEGITSENRVARLNGRFGGYYNIAEAEARRRMLIRLYNECADGSVHKESARLLASPHAGLHPEVLEKMLNALPVESDLEIVRWFTETIIARLPDYGLMPNELSLEDKQLLIQVYSIAKNSDEERRNAIIEGIFDQLKLHEIIERGSEESRQPDSLERLLEFLDSIEREID